MFDLKVSWLAKHSLFFPPMGWILRALGGVPVVRHENNNVVDDMIEVFNIMAVTGGGDAKSMAGGVSRATVPTMAGMVAALSGVFANTYVTGIAQREGEFLEDNLTTDH